MMSEKKLVPKRRFEEFKDDGAWEQRKLGELAQISSGGTPNRKNGSFWNGTIPWATTAEIKYSLITDTNEKITLEGLNGSSAKLLPIGTILLAMYGQGKTRGKVAILGVEATTNQANANIVVAPNIDNHFIYYQLDKQYETLRNLANEGSQANLSLNIIKDISVSLSSNFSEQRKIATFFSILDNLITLQQKTIDKTKALKSAYLAEMFPAEGESVPKRRFAGFTGEWKTQKIGDIYTVTRGNVLSATKVSPIKTSKMQYPVYSSQTLNDGLLGYYDQYLYNQAITWTTDGANAGTVNYRAGKFYSTNVNGVLLSNDGYSCLAVAEALNQIAWKHVSKVGNPKLMNDVMSKIFITLPSSHEELSKISTFFNNINKIITTHQQKLAKLKATKQAYLNEMFV